MRTTKTAAALLLSVLIAIVSVSSGLPQSSPPPGSVTVEGTWLVTSEVDTKGSDLGKTVTIRRKGPGEYEAFWPHTGETIIWHGTDSKIKFLQTQTFDLLKGVYFRTGVPDSALREAAGVQITFYYIPSPDGRTLQFLRDNLNLSWDTKSGRLLSSKISPPSQTAAILTRVAEPAAAQKALPAPAPQTAPASAPAKKTETSPVAQVESRGEFYVLTKDGRKLTGAEAKKIPLEEGTKVVTGKGGHVRMTLPDDTTFTVGANTDLVIDKFVYDPDGTPKTIMANVSKGMFRWVTGKTARKDPAKMKVTLPIGDLGIRGTDFEALVEPNGRGRVALYAGQLEITEKKSGYTFILDAGQMVTFGPGGKISRPKKIKGAQMLEDEEED
ncbi:MAG: FecR domain-containing protein [Deltaproteobacteria bacterium]|nr:FecR domain-containing protein [Deltaproteobacteria bacterium]MBI4796546.1 FecR domain-containing protein [Deltaproteobacteria bacterium]